MYQLDSIRARHDRYTSLIESDSVSVICHINSQLYLSLHLHVYIVQTKSVHGDTTRYHRLDNIILFTLISDIADNQPIKVTIFETQYKKSVCISH